MENIEKRVWFNSIRFPLFSFSGHSNFSCRNSKRLHGFEEMYKRLREFEDIKSQAVEVTVNSKEENS
jgi:hypothetical protein